MAVAAHHDQIRAVIRSMRENAVGERCRHWSSMRAFVLMPWPERTFARRFAPLTLGLPHTVETPTISTVPACFRRRHRSRDRLGRPSRFRPTTTMTWSSFIGARLDVGHDQERTPGNRKRHGLDEERPALLAIGAGLLDHGEIIIARHPLKLSRRGQRSIMPCRTKPSTCTPTFPGLGLNRGETGLRFPRGWLRAPAQARHSAFPE